MAGIPMGGNLNGMKNPPKLDRFTPLDFEVLQHVADHGQITIVFNTDNQAMNSKYRLWRLKESLLVNAPGTPLAEAARYFVFKVRQDTLTIVNRQGSQEEDAYRAALRGEVEKISADPMEMRPLNIKESEDSNDTD